MSNPYSPGAGRRPAALVGRDEQRAAWASALARVAAGRGERSMVLYGLRGVGKTVLLVDLQAAAEDVGWIVGYTEAGAGKSLRSMISDALQSSLADLARPSAGAQIRKALKTFVSFKTSVSSEGVWTFGLDLDADAGGGADSGALEFDVSTVVRDICAAASGQGVGLALLIDEAQDLTREELTVLCSTAHLATQRNLPLLIALAGLPSLPVQLAEAKSYAERLFAFHQVRELAHHDARDAIVEPAVEQGVVWDGDAVTHLIDATGGYPYFLQEYGQAAWNWAPDGAGRICYDDARLGGLLALRDLDSGFFRVRWERATPKERDYLQAMAIDGDGGSSSGEVAKRLGKKLTSLGPARASLIAKGLIYAPEHGRVAFTVPRMADFINRQARDF
nr:ATP-binding protein [Arsenicicoccus piscis]